MFIQVTLISRIGYKPISTIINLPNETNYESAKSKAKQRGIERICAQRHMTIQDLRKYEYYTLKMRVVEEEKN